MKTLFKKILAISAIVLTITASLSFIAPVSTYADDGKGSSSGSAGSCESLMGLVPWSCGVPMDDNNGVMVNSEDDLVNVVIIIISNVLTDIIVAAAYLVVGYVIYGGYQYMFSSGDTAKVSSGKKTLVHAFTGLGIVMLANVIVSSIRIAFLGANGSFSNNTLTNLNANVLFTNLLQWVIGISGAVAAIFLVIGGISYMTSSGDTAKLQKAKNTILYAIIGLVIVALAELITSFVSNIIRGNQSQSQSYYNQIIIAKELNEK